MWDDVVWYHDGGGDLALFFQNKTVSRSLFFSADVDKRVTIHDP
jgi:hypothetical protein